MAAFSGFVPRRLILEGLMNAPATIELLLEATPKISVVSAKDKTCDLRPPTVPKWTSSGEL